MKKGILIALVALVSMNLSAQKAFTKSAKVAFAASSPIEKIEATTSKGTLVVDAATARLEAAVLVKGFHFERALMEEHFNENYMESGKFPQATFAGDITDMKSIDVKKDGDYAVNIKGKMTLHGITKDLATKGTLTVKGGVIVAAKSSFAVKLADFGIAIPSAVADKIAKEAKVDISGSLLPLK